jgi:competence protein ComEC
MSAAREHSSVSIWHAPLVPVALAATIGIVLDRYFAIELAMSVATTAALWLAWFVLRAHAENRMRIALLLLAFVPLGASWHHWRHRTVRADDIRFSISPEGTMARLRGRIDAEPTVVRGPREDPLRSFPARDATRLLVRAADLQHKGDWSVVSGLVQATIPEVRRDLHVGDEIELVGILALPGGPANPGGFDFAAYCQDQGISALLAAPASPGAVELLREGWPRTLHGWLAMARSWGLQVLERHVPEPQRGVAAALLLGDSRAMTTEEWDQYIRTGVVHVLAISGQHLFVLSGFLWVLLGLTRINHRGCALVVIVLIVGYALMVGARPPIVRAAWITIVLGFGVFLQRLVVPANAYALSWLGVAIATPAALFDFGCQLSFLAVGMLLWGRFQISFLAQNLVTWALRQEAHPEALQKVIEESRSPWERKWRRGIRGLAIVYFQNAVIWLVLAPLIAARTNVVSPIALLIGPPIVVLSSFALVVGFLLLAVGGWLPPAALVFGLVTNLLLTCCRNLVAWTAALPGAYFFMPDIEMWWVLGFYLGLVGVMVLRAHVSSFLLAMPAVAWGILGLALLAMPRAAEFRCTFLAVGHGGCVVLETPDGKTLVYDAGAITGPDVTRRHIAPYLWSRGIRRIDELLISHGDLDHFNGIPDLLEYFAVDRLTLTPSFADRTTPGVGHTLRVFEQIGVKTRVVSTSDRWDVDGISFEVLHPPERGPEGNENARSLVLLIRYRDLILLLTGDLQGPGLARLLGMPPVRVDVLQAPHHGSPASNTRELAEWAQPSVVISSQGPPRSVPKQGNAYEAIGARYLTTWPHGAITVRREAAGFVIETYQTNNHWPLR